MNELVSVIVPVYNVEKYLNRCIKSIVNQTYENIEIILIDDGSQDSSGKICDEWKQTDDRIKVVHKKNGGVSSARNLGIQIGRGKYITFVDSDDYICNDFVEKFYNLTENNTIIVRSIANFYGSEMESNSNEFLYFFENTIYFNATVNMFIERQWLIENNIKFNENTGFGEDLLFSLTVMLKAKKFKVTNYEGYNFCFDNKESISRTNNKEKMIQNILELLIVYNEIYNNLLINVRTNRIFEQINFYILQLFSNYEISYNEFVILLKNIYKNLNEDIFEKFNKNKKYNILRKLYIYCIFRKKFILYYVLLNLRKLLKKGNKK